MAGQLDMTLVMKPKKKLPLILPTDINTALLTRLEMIISYRVPNNSGDVTLASFLGKNSIAGQENNIVAQVFMKIFNNFMINILRANKDSLTNFKHS